MKLDEVTKEMSADGKGGYSNVGDMRRNQQQKGGVGGGSGGHKGNSKTGVLSWPARLAHPGGWCWAGGHWV